MKYILFFLLFISLLSCSDSVKQRFDDHINQSDTDENVVIDLDVNDKVDSDFNVDNDRVEDVDISKDNDIIQDEMIDEFCDETPDEDVITTLCEPNPCKNGGICTEKDESFVCDCKNTGFNGPHCDYNPQAFITTWKTDNPGVSGGNQITIHISVKDETPGYNIDCDNNGVFEAENQMTKYTCEYERPGIYTISIIGSLSYMYFGDNAIDIGCMYPPCDPYSFDNEKLLSVEQWGNIKWNNMIGVFHRCYSLIINATDAPDLSNVTDTGHMFYMATSFNQNINHWDVSNVENMYSMFEGARSFNQDVSSWNVSNVTDMRNMFNYAKSFDQDLGSWNVSNVRKMGGMFAGVTLSTENYDALLNGWSKLELQKNVQFGADDNMYCKGAAARELLYDKYRWGITDGGKDPDCEE